MPAPGSREAIDQFFTTRITKIDNLYGKVEADYNTLSSLIKKFSVDVPGARYMPKVQSGVWDGKIRFISFDGKFPIGIFNEVRDILTQWVDNRPKDDPRKLVIDPAFDIMDDVQDLRKFTHRYMNTGEFNRKRVKEGEADEIGVTFWPPHDHQWKLSKLAIDHKQCIIEAATSSGKTWMLAMICNYLQHSGKVENILVVVPKVDLVVQGQRDLVDYGIPEEWIGMVFGGIKDYGRKITISTWQSLNVDDKEFFEGFDCVIVDECFVGDTLVNTVNGKVKIKDIKVGDLIWTKNEQNDVKELKEVEVVYNNRTSSTKLIELEMEDGNIIKCTPNHEFFTLNRGWVKAFDLTHEDEL